METTDMAKEQVQEILDSIEWTKIHSLTVFEDYGSTIHVKADGSFFVLGSGTSLGDYSEILGTIPVVGYGNIDDWDYLEGWGEWNREDDTFLTDDGRTLTIEEAIADSIENGDWTESIECWQKSLLGQWQKDVEEEEDRKRMQELKKFGNLSKGLNLE